MAQISQDRHAPVFVGDNLALDFINTRYGVGDDRTDCFVDDASVVAWMKQAMLLPDDFGKAPGGLLKLARELRDNARRLVDAAKAGTAADAGVVNHVLELGRGRSELVWDDASGAFTVVKARRKDDAAGLLEPVAQALVNLLTAEQLALVRQCEAHDCTLMFHDLTKSHRRRWCSMALCGNRMKVAAFRSRQKAGEA
jgi:predicted RNA-binding Zn ribbon-like protein